ncbi:MAG: UDP-glucose 4-epimerase GalE [Chlamydiales bacterium]
MERNILITGGAGYIGSHLNKALNQAGYHTVIFDNLARGSRDSVYYGEFFVGDINNEDDLKRLFEYHKFDAVMHLAALTDVGDSVQNPFSYYRTNVVGTLKLLDKMLEYDVRRCIFSSSAAVYGMPLSPIMKEEHPLSPINPYGKSKLMCEFILDDYDHAYGLRYCSLRYFNAAGGDPKGEIKNYKSDEHNLIPKLLRCMLKNDGNITIYGTDYPTRDGTCVRDYIHVNDICNAHILALEHLLNGYPSSTYNLGNGNGFSVREVINAGLEATGRKVNVIEGNRRAGDPPELVADSTKARNELGWTPQYPDIQTIVSHAWKSFSHLHSFA